MKNIDLFFKILKFCSPCRRIERAGELVIIILSFVS